MTRFICLKQGHKYGVDYVNILHNRVRHYLPTLTEFVCYTDTPDMAFDAGITVINLPSNLGIHGWWFKCWILGQSHPGENIYMDLDMLVNGDLSVYRPDDSQALWGLWNRVHLNSSILAWWDSMPTVWSRFYNRKSYHMGRGGTYGDQEIINLCVDKSDFEQKWYPQHTTAWLDVRRNGLARDWDTTQASVVCKGPRNPHENLEHPLVHELWRLR